MDQKGTLYEGLEKSWNLILLWMGEKLKAGKGIKSYVTAELRKMQVRRINGASKANKKRKKNRQKRRRKSKFQ